MPNAKSEIKKQKTAYLIIAHGSRDSESNEAFLDVVSELRKTNPNQHIQEAFLELANPLIAEGIESCLQLDCGTLYVIPMMLFPGRHVKKDIPLAIQEAKENYPDVDFHYAGPLSSCAPLSKWLHETMQKEFKHS